MRVCANPRVGAGRHLRLQPVDQGVQSAAPDREQHMGAVFRAGHSHGDLRALQGVCNEARQGGE